jgi:hypothetical protein
MIEIITAILGVVVVGGASVFAYVMYLTSGFHESERRNHGRPV